MAEPPEQGGSYQAKFIDYGWNFRLYLISAPIRLILSDSFAGLQASMFDCFLLDPFSAVDDRLSSAEVDIGRCDVF